MAKKSPQVQEGFLFEALRERRILSIELMSGAALRGVLKRFDQFTLVLENDQGSLVIYKSSVVSITAISEHRDTA